MPPSWFATKGQRGMGRGRMWRKIENTVILYFAHLLVFAGKTANVVRKNSNLKNTNTVSRDHHFDIDWMHEVKTIRESQQTWVLIQKYILMWDRRRRENNKHAPRAAFLLSVDFYIAFESVIQSSFEFFVSIHLLLVFDCPFFVGQRVVSI